MTITLSLAIWIFGRIYVQYQKPANLTYLFNNTSLFNSSGLFKIFLVHWQEYAVLWSQDSSRSQFLSGLAKDESLHPQLSKQRKHLPLTFLSPVNSWLQNPNARTQKRILICQNWLSFKCIQEKQAQTKQKPSVATCRNKEQF